MLVHRLETPPHGRLQEYGNGTIFPRRFADPPATRPWHGSRPHARLLRRDGSAYDDPVRTDQPRGWMEAWPLIRNRHRRSNCTSHPGRPTGARKRRDSGAYHTGANLQAWNPSALRHGVNSIQYAIRHCCTWRSRDRVDHCWVSAAGAVLWYPNPQRRRYHRIQTPRFPGWL